MNTANLQLEGLCLAVAMINNLLVRKGILTTEEIEGALATAGDTAREDRANVLPPANLEAIRFPIRLLQLANAASSETEIPNFAELARMIGEQKYA